MWRPFRISQPVIVLIAMLLLSVVAMGQGVVINGPNVLDVKEAELFPVEGLTVEEFKQCSVHVRPEVNKPQVVILQTLGNIPVLYVKGFTAGAFDIILDVNIPDHYELVFHELTIGGGDDDDDPFVLPGQKLVVVVMESKNPSSPNVLSQVKLVNWMQDNNVDYRSWDPHQKEDGKTPAPLRAVLNKGARLPVVAVVAESSEGYVVIGVEPLSAKLDEAIDFLKKHGVE